MTPSEFKWYRKHLKLTQAELALELEVSPNTIYNIERSHSPVPAYYALAIKHLAWEKHVKPLLLELL